MQPNLEKKSPRMMTVSNLNDTHSSLVKMDYSNNVTPQTEMTTIKDYKSTGYRKKGSDFIKI